MAADIHLGAVYYEDTTDGEDTTPDVIDITWTGGPANAELTTLVINMDKNGNGVLDPGETFFDTSGPNFGVGQFGNADLQLVANGFTILSATTLQGAPGDWDGATSIVLTFSGFTVGKHLLIQADIDEKGFFNSASSLVEGDEFQFSIMTGTFNAPHYKSATGSGVFLDDYSDSAADLVGLPRDDYFTPPALPVPLRTAGAFINLTPEPLGSIRGNVHADYDGDCLVDPGEPMLAGVTIQLLDSAGNVIGTTLTDVNGEYEFLDLEAGTYGVREIQPDAYFNGGTLVGTINGVTVGTTTTPNVITGIQLAAGQQGVEYNFCEKFGSVSGRVHADVDGDCEYDVGEVLISGVKMELLDAGGNVIATTFTDANGEYKFDQLIKGVYSVRETQPNLYFDGGDNIGTVGGITTGTRTTNDRIDNIELIAARDGINYNFCEKYGALSGRVIVDLNANNVIDLAQERPIAGVVIELRDAVGNVIRTTQTDADGRYSFDLLTRGVYSVREVQPNFLDAPDYLGTVDGLPSGVTTNDLHSQISLLDGRFGINYDFTERFEDPPIIIIVPPESPPPFTANPAEPPPAITPPPLRQLFVQPPATDLYNSGIVGYTWHLSVVNAGKPRTPRLTQSQMVARTREIAEIEALRPDWSSDAVRHGKFILRTGEDDQATEREVVFGVENATPVVGDFNGDGNADIGVFREGSWYIDLNGNGVWDQADLWAKLGRQGDLPVTGDWDGDGKADIAIFGKAWPGDPRHIAGEPGLPSDINAKQGFTKNIPPQADEATLGVRAMQLTSTGSLRSDLIDHVFLYGWGGDQPIAGDWTGEGQEMIGIFRNGAWKLDLTGDGVYGDADLAFAMGEASDKPVIGDFDGDTRVDLGIYRDGLWHIDTNHDRVLDARDRAFSFGEAGDRPVVGDWDGDGIDDPGVYRDNGK